MLNVHLDIIHFLRRNYNKIRCKGAVPKKRYLVPFMRDACPAQQKQPGDVF